MDKERFLKQIEEYMMEQRDKLENAKEVCRNTAGPTASICLQGLERSNESVESIEKSICHSELIRSNLT